MVKELGCINGAAGTGDNDWMTVGKSHAASAIRGTAEPLHPPVAAALVLLEMLQNTCSQIRVRILPGMPWRSSI